MEHWHKCERWEKRGWKCPSAAILGEEEHRRIQDPSEPETEVQLQKEAVGVREKRPLQDIRIADRAQLEIMERVRKLDVVGRETAKVSVEGEPFPTPVPIYPIPLIPGIPGIPVGATPRVPTGAIAAMAVQQGMRQLGQMERASEVARVPGRTSVERGRYAAAIAEESTASAVVQANEEDVRGIPFGPGAGIGAAAALEALRQHQTGRRMRPRAVESAGSRLIGRTREVVRAPRFTKPVQSVGGFGHFQVNQAAQMKRLIHGR